MKLPIYHLDAFTQRAFGGNPAAVIPLGQWLADDVMQAIAAENNVSETAFVVTSEPACPLRWFTPTVEVDLCGHATLAAADVLFREYYRDATRITFSTASGDMTVARDGSMLAMNFPSRPGRSVEITPETVTAIGRRPRELLLARDLMAVLDHEDDVRDFDPDAGRIASIDAFALIVTAPGVESDFVSRFFAPNAGIPEDPATGSSHCTLTPYWARRLGKTSLTARQLSARGAELACDLRGERVVISGHVVEYMRGEITF